MLLLLICPLLHLCCIQRKSLRILRRLRNVHRGRIGLHIVHHARRRLAHLHTHIRAWSWLIWLAIDHVAILLRLALLSLHVKVADELVQLLRRRLHLHQSLSVLRRQASQHLHDLHALLIVHGLLSWALLHLWIVLVHHLLMMLEQVQSRSVLRRGWGLLIWDLVLLLRRAGCLIGWCHGPIEHGHGWTVDLTCWPSIQSIRSVESARLPSELICLLLLLHGLLLGEHILSLHHRLLLLLQCTLLHLIRHLWIALIPEHLRVDTLGLSLIHI